MEKEVCIVVTGGAGYIGSHFVNLLKDRQHTKIVVVDTFQQSRNNIVESSNVEYCEVDIRDVTALKTIFTVYAVDAVVHFAAVANVPDSLIHPNIYYETNVTGGLNLLSCMLEHGVKIMLFSSSASVYGEPAMEVISENHTTMPINPYGYTKLVFERILQDYNQAYGVASVAFRYFCAAGCDISGKLGEHHNPETHVIPALIETALGKRPVFYVYGNDFSTPDGTGIRDYIHVNDLASAHLRALNLMLEGKKGYFVYNLGINKGFSVMELIRATERVTGAKIKYEIKQRRPGDPSKLIANANKAQSELSWNPQYVKIEDILTTSYNYYHKNQ